MSGCYHDSELDPNALYLVQLAMEPGCPLRYAGGSCWPGLHPHWERGGSCFSFPFPVHLLALAPGVQCHSRLFHHEVEQELLSLKLYCFGCMSASEAMPNRAPCRCAQTARFTRTKKELTSAVARIRCHVHKGLLVTRNVATVGSTEARCRGARPHLARAGTWLCPSQGMSFTGCMQ